MQLFHLVFFVSMFSAVVNAAVIPVSPAPVDSGALFGGGHRTPEPVQPKDILATKMGQLGEKKPVNELPGPGSLKALLTAQSNDIIGRIQQLVETISGLLPTGELLGPRQVTSGGPLLSSTESTLVNTGVETAEGSLAGAGDGLREGKPISQTINGVGSEAEGLAGRRRETAVAEHLQLLELL